MTTAFSESQVLHETLSKVVESQRAVGANEHLLAILSGRFWGHVFKVRERDHDLVRRTAWT